MTDEQFKAWAKSFLERTDTYSSWRGAAVEAIQLLEEERAKNATLVEALENLATNARAAITFTYRPEVLTTGGFDFVLSKLESDAREALAKIKGDK